MKGLLLTRAPEAHGNRRLAEVARERGWDFSVVDSLAPLVLPSSGQVLLDGRALSGVDAVVARFGPELQAAGLVALRACESLGARALAGAASFALARDKVASLARFREAGLAFPESAVVSDRSHAEAAVESVGSGPVLVKPAQGWCGKGLLLFEDRREAIAHLQDEADARTPILVQRFVAEAEGESARLMVVDGEVVAAARFRAAEGDFRANASAGGSAEAWSPGPASAAAAQAAVAALGLRAGGVDLLTTPSGPLLLEVNAAPGFRALESATGADVASALISALERS
jgi:ribosomal protein S6--L-glutamate ligase